MALPTYGEDLTDIDLAEAASTGFVALNISGGGGGAPAFGADLGMQGAGCWDKPCSNAERAIAVNKTPGAGTVAAGVHIFQWGFCATPGITDTLATRGAYVLAGTGTGDIVQFHVEGSDTYGAVGRVGRCYAYRYVTTANTGSVPYRTVLGTPGATPTYFGYGLKTIATAKGSNIGMDAVRYGTGAYISDGEVANPGTFDGFATQNDSINNRWGILTKVGTSYELQGRFVIGQNNAGTPTQAYFEDSDVNISLVDTVHSETDFTQIIVDQASTQVYFTNISITALGTNNPGQFNITDASVVSINGGTWTEIGTTSLDASATVDGLTWRRCGAVTSNGSAISNCTFDGNTSPLVLTNLSEISNCTFIRGTAGHGINLGTISANIAMGWDSFTDGYVAASNANETILVSVDSGVTLTINVTGGNSPSVYNTGLGSVSVVSSATLSIVGLEAGTEVRIHRTSDLTLLDGIETVVTADGITYTDGKTRYKFDYNYSTVEPIFIQVLNLNYIFQKINYTLTAGGGTLPVQQIIERNYSNP